MFDYFRSGRFVLTVVAYWILVGCLTARSGLRFPVFVFLRLLKHGASCLERVSFYFCCLRAAGEVSISCLADVLRYLVSYFIYIFV